MEEITALAAYETINVLYNSEISLVCKIPYKFLDFLQTKAKEYNGEATFNDTASFKEQNLSDETHALLAIIYKDYLCDDDEKARINELIKQSQVDFEQSQNEKYSYDNIFKKPNEKNTDSNLNPEVNVENIETTKSENKSSELTELAVPQKWYEKIIMKIRSIFKK